MFLFNLLLFPGGTIVQTLNYCEVDTSTYNQLTAPTLNYCEVDTSGYPRS